MLACICGGTLEALFIGAVAGITWLLTRFRLWRRRPCTNTDCKARHS